MLYAYLEEINTRDPHQDVLDKLDCTIQACNQGVLQCIGSLDDRLPESPKNTRRIAKRVSRCSFVSIAVEFGLYSYVSTKITSKSPCKHRSLPMLYIAIANSPVGMEIITKVAIIELLLQRGYSPNEQYLGQTALQAAFACASADCGDWAALSRWLEIITLLSKAVQVLNCFASQASTLVVAQLLKLQMRSSRCPSLKQRGNFRTLCPVTVLTMARLQFILTAHLSPTKATTI
jgi:hypothetical protein